MSINTELEYIIVEDALLKGEKGDTGERGLQGLQGPIGLTGPNGPKGDTGDTGLTGPKGDVGPQGPQGPKGETGLTGASGYTPVKGVDYFDGDNGMDATINGVNTLTITEGANIDLTQIESTATISVSPIISDIDEIHFDTTPTSTDALLEGQLRWNSAEHTLDIGFANGVTLQVGQESNIYVRNEEATTLADGTPVYISGAQGQTLTVKKALATSNATAYVIGVTSQNINSKKYGYVTTYGLVRGINLGAYTEGTPLWLSTTGTITNTPPVLPNAQSFIGWVAKEGNNGSIYVLPKLLEVANDTLILDTANYFTSTNVEGALQEIGLELDGVAEALDTILG